MATELSRPAAEKVKIRLKDSSEKEYPKGCTAFDIARDISQRMAKTAVAARLNGKVVDLNTPIYQNSSLEILTFDDEDGKDVYRHSTAHVLAQAVKNLFPNVKLGIGPPIEDGFYYDFSLPKSFKPEDLEAIEKEMNEIIKKDYQFVRHEMQREDALEFFRKRGEDYKVELINDLPEEEKISLYSQGEFWDLCVGPHLPSTGRIKAVKLLNLAGAYWRGNEKNEMMQRIYGTSFPKKRMLEDYLKRIEEAKKRDHRRLGTQMELFSLKEAGPGFPFFHPKGMVLRIELENFWREEHKKAGYQEIKTPIILNRTLWEQSGHWEHYRENMYFTSIDGEDYAIKPMNCPGAMLVYSSGQHSYREFPLRFAEMGLVHRHELSGVLHGLMRVRAFTQDDAHIFMLPSQIKEEIQSVIALVDRIYKMFNFSYYVELSTKPSNAMGSDDIWEKAITSLKEAMDEKEMEYTVNEGEGAFYGPKIDFHLQDSLGRTWQCGTIQLDFLMPEKFNLTYIGEDGNKHRPVMIHRVIFGSIERFIGILIEHYGGAFPTWISPVQVRILPIAERHLDYAYKIRDEINKYGIRVEVDTRNEKVGYKIRQAQIEKVPYMLVLGDKEKENENVSVRKRKEGDQGSKPLKEFLKIVSKEIKLKVAE